MGRTLVAQPEELHPMRIPPERGRNGFMPAAIQAKQLALVQVEEKIGASRIGALGKHSRLGVGGPVYLF
jgi:hypothetical protein